jgi:type IV pilus assembly protein PilE
MKTVSSNPIPAPSRDSGFTVMEMMIAGVMLAIAASIALPSYGNHVKRSRILDGVAKLSDHRARMEQFFLDRRAYVDGLGNCGIAPPAAAGSDAFELSCVATASSYVYTASGIASKGMAGFVYTIDESGTRATLSLPAGWTRTSDCWTVRADGSCV